MPAAKAKPRKSSGKRDWPSHGASAQRYGLQPDQGPIMPRFPFAVSAIAGLLALAAPLSVRAEETTSHDGHMMSGDMGPSSMAFMEANDRMHAAMAMEFTGNADVDFVRGMIPHHQGAVEMARIVLEHGSDPEVRKLAEGVIAAQEAEIKWMQDWLAQHGG
jgi:uncharacterized protein (DUF305 family)